MVSILLLPHSLSRVTFPQQQRPSFQIFSFALHFNLCLISNWFYRTIIRTSCTYLSGVQGVMARIQEMYSCQPLLSFNLSKSDWFFCLLLLLYLLQQQSMIFRFPLKVVAVSKSLMKAVIRHPALREVRNLLKLFVKFKERFITHIWRYDNLRTGKIYSKRWTWVALMSQHLTLSCLPPLPKLKR